MLWNGIELFPIILALISLWCHPSGGSKQFTIMQTFFGVLLSEILYGHYKKHSRNAWEYLFTKIILVSTDNI